MDPEADYLNFLHSNDKMFHGDKYLVVAGFYKFFELDDLKKFQSSFKSIFFKTKIKGTILIANEGVNGTISGEKK